MDHRKILDKIFNVFALSQNCQRIYLAGFEKGNLTPGQLANDLNMDRSSTYLAIDQLKSQGLIEVDETRRPMVIHVLPPRTILARIERKIQNLEEAFDTSHNDLPRLEAAYHGQDDHPKLQGYHGKDGLYQISEQILLSGVKEMLLFTNQTAESQLFNRNDHAHFIRQRKQNSIFIRVLATDDDYARDLQKTDKTNSRQTKIISGNPPFECELYIFGDSVAMLSFTNEVIGFVVRSPDFAKIMKWQFEQLWSTL